MWDRLGTVTNTWALRLEDGERFEALATAFGAQGFREIEVRDGEYLLHSEFGRLLREITATMDRYCDDEWKGLCAARFQSPDGVAPLQSADRELFGRMGEILARTRELTLTYAISHPWVSQPADIAADNRRIAQAKRLAVLLSPRWARLRLVDLEATGTSDPQTAVANLVRYRSLLSGFPVVLAVENAHQPASFTLQLARQAKTLLAYDEANSYHGDGTTIEPATAFWSAVTMADLTSVHFKQKTADGVLPRVADGFVDFAPMVRRLQTQEFSGDLLFENAPSATPLENALQSRVYLRKLAN